MDRRNAGRIVVQLLLVAPMVLLFPFALLLPFTGMAMLFEGGAGAASLLLALAQVLAPLCLIVLFISIFLGTPTLRRAPWRGPVTAGLLGGVLVTVAWQASLLIGPDAFPEAALNPYNLYVFGGAALVAGWNLWRAWGQAGQVLPAGADSRDDDGRPAA